MRWRRWGRIACLPREHPPGTSMGSRNPLTSHLDGEEGAGVSCVVVSALDLTPTSRGS
jgi:hypothetical protein